MGAQSTEGFMWVMYVTAGFMKMLYMTVNVVCLCYTKHCRVSVDAVRDTILFTCVKNVTMISCCSGKWVPTLRTARYLCCQGRRKMREADIQMAVSQASVEHLLQ